MHDMIYIDHIFENLDILHQNNLFEINVDDYDLDFFLNFLLPM